MLLNKKELEKARKKFEKLTIATPTGELRTALSEVGIIILSYIEALDEIKNLNFKFEYTLVCNDQLRKRKSFPKGKGGKK